MKKPTKFIACSTSLLFAAAVSLQAQSSDSGSAAGSTGASGSGSSATGATGSGATATSSGISGTNGTSSDMGATGTSAGQSSSATGSQFGTTNSSQAATPSSSFNSTASNQTPSSTQNSSSSMNANGSAAGSMSGSVNSSNNFSAQTQSQTQGPSVTYPNNSANTNNTSSMSANSTQTGVQSNTGTQQSSTQNYFAGGTTDSQVTTFVQQLDTQGPAVVQRISTQVGDLACSDDTIQNLVDALHSGRSVTISANGQSSTFNASGAHLGYGDAYLAIALAAQELRNAGVSSCATPEQWQAVLLGGPLTVSQTSSTTNSYASASGSNTMPGIVTLHKQGQGWGQIAQSGNVQIGQILHNSVPSATGYSSAEREQGYNSSHADSDKGHKKHHWWNREKNADKDNDSDANASDTNNNGNSASSHADTSANGSSATSSTTTPSTK